MCPIYFYKKERFFTMKKLKMSKGTALTFEEGCNKYLENCRQRNLRQGTINHYKQSYKQFYKYFNPKMPVEDIDENMYKNYVLHLKSIIHNDVSINSYLRNLITTLHFFMNEGYIPHFKMQAINVDKSQIETYTEAELKLLLKKPNLKKCNFTEYESWVMTNFLFSTGVRQRSLINYKKHKTTDDYLFCNSFGQQLVKSTCYTMLYDYNKRRGVEKTGIHRYRHTFAKQWMLNGGNVVSLSKLLGHLSLDITENYIHLLVSDIAEQVNEFNALDKFYGKKHISMAKN